MSKLGPSVAVCPCSLQRAIIPRRGVPYDLSSGANCQVYAYPLLRHFGVRFFQLCGRASYGRMRGLLSAATLSNLWTFYSSVGHRSLSELTWRCVWARAAWRFI
jgi:hypothetical protein